MVVAGVVLVCETLSIRLSAAAIDAKISLPAVCSLSWNNNDASNLHDLSRMMNPANLLRL
jgi:hypothetical protein